MIDEKKIDESARDYINKNGYFVKYDEDPCVDIEFAYKEGAEWAINEFLKDLWHDASEKPVISEHGMILVELNDITACKYSLWRSTTTYECLSNNKGYIRRWLYIDDLLKGGKK